MARIGRSSRLGIVVLLLAPAVPAAEPAADAQSGVTAALAVQVLATLEG